MYKIILAIIMLLASTVSAEEAFPEVTKGKIERISSFNSQLIASRFIDVWLPPGYSASQKYDVLYMHDARMLFDKNTTWNKQEWMLDETAGRLIELNKVRPFIVVAIPNAKENRHSEYFPQKPFESISPQQQTEMYKLRRSPEQALFNTRVYSDSYLAFIVKELIPYIEREYSVNIGGKHRYLAGSSMGGLISWYGLMEYPNEFAGAICMSSHWPGGFADNEVLFNAFYDYIQSNLPRLTKQKVYFDYGDQTLDALYPPLQKQIDALFIKHRYPKKQWRSQFFPNENHSEKSWAKRLDEPLAFMFKNSVKAEVK